jgi:outer membrane protein assembly factor BamB
MLASVLLVSAVAGCKDGTGPRQEPVATVVIGNVPDGTLLSGATVQLTATPLDASGATLSNRKITWSTSDETIAGVSTGGLVTAVGAGPVTIRATAEGKHGEAVLDVRGGGTVGPNGGTLALLHGAITLVVPENSLPQTVTILARPEPRPTAHPRLVTGTAFEIGPEPVTFFRGANLTIRYDDANVPAGLSASSLQLYVRWGDDHWTPIRGSRVDQTTRMVSGGIARTGTYAVVSTGADRVEIHGALLSGAMYGGQVGQFTASVLDTFGDTLSGRTIDWSSSSATTVAIDATGKVTGGAAGTATITASVDGKSASTTVTVLPRPTPSWRQTADWTTFQGDASRMGSVAATLDPVVFSQLWETTLATGVALNPPSAGEGKVFVSTHSGGSQQRLFAISAQTGSQLWSHDFGSIHSVHPPAYGHGRVFVTTGGHGDSYLYSFDAGTGAVRFRSSYGNQWSRYFAPAVVDQRVYMAGGRYGGMYAFDAVEGEQLWFASTDQTSLWAPAVSAGRVYAYTSPGLSVVDAASGAELYAIRDANFGSVGWGMQTTPVLGSMDNVLATQAGRIVSFDLASRTVGWERKASFTGNVTVADGRIYVRNDAQLEARRESDGSLLWIWIPPSGKVEGTMVVTDNVLFLSTNTPSWGGGEWRTFAIDLESGRRVWAHPGGGELALSAEGILYIAQRNGKLTAISVR